LKLSPRSRPSPARATAQQTKHKTQNTTEHTVALVLALLLLLLLLLLLFLSIIFHRNTIHVVEIVAKTLFAPSKRSASLNHFAMLFFTTTI
jgi:type VI protein secretion system component VasF